MENACIMMNQVIDNGADILYDKYLAPKVIPYAAAHWIATIKHGLDTSFQTRDFGTTKEEIDENWQSGEEPVSK